MTNDATPHILQSVHPVALWIESARQQEPRTPDDLPITQLRVLAVSATECLPYLFRTDPPAAISVTSGQLPIYLGPGRTAGEGWFELTAPCVVWLWTLDPTMAVRSELMLVLAGRQLRAFRKALYHPQPSLMTAMTVLVHQPKPKQLDAGRRPEPGGRDAD